MNPYYKEGWRAFYDGKSEADNPYAEETAQHSSWLRGFRDAAFDDEV